MVSWYCSKESSLGRNNHQHGTIIEYTVFPTPSVYLCLTQCRRKDCGLCFLTWKSGSFPFLVVSPSMEWWAITFALNTFSFSFLCSVMEVRGIRVNCGKLLHYADLLKVEVNTLWATAKPVCFPQSWRERREKVKNMSTLNNLMITSKESTKSRAGRGRGKHLGNLLLGYTD